MIAIDVIMKRKNNEEFDDDYTIPIASKYYHNVYSFFKNCIDQNIVLNAVCHPDYTHTRYYATSIENALSFQNAFTDTSAEFSIKNMWEENGFDISLSQNEIDFDTESWEIVKLIEPTGQIWGEISAPIG